MSRIFAISDIHGHYEEFIALIKKIGYQKGVDKLYILGDMVDRGPDSIKLLSLLRNLQMQYPTTVKVIRGNHDDEFLKVAKMLVKGQTYNEEDWNMYAGFTGNDLEAVNVFHNVFDQDTKLKLVDWMNTLPYYIEDGPYIFVHAGVNPSLPLNSQSPQLMLWGKVAENDQPFYFKKAYQGKVVVFGHTPTRIMHKHDSGSYNSNIWFDLKNYDKICIDCCVWGGGTLGALEIDPATDKYTEHYL